MLSISIIIPVYQVDKFIEACLDSILVQSISNFELILVDDGSIDKSGILCDEFTLRDTRVIVCHRKNSGVSSARNLGINCANGEQIFFIDADDTVDIDYIQDLRILGNEDMVQGDCKVLENEYLKPFMTHEEIIADFGRYWTESGSFSCWCKCFNKKFLDNHSLRFEENFSFAEDERFIISCLQQVSLLRRTDSCKYNYNTEISTSATKKLRLNRLEIEQDFCERMEKVVINPSQVMPLRFLRWHYAFNHYYKFYKLEKNAYTKRQIKDAIKQAYKSVFFRECLPYIRSNGSLDQKIECYFMSYYSHKFYIPILRVVQFLSQIKRKIGGR